MLDEVEYLAVGIHAPGGGTLHAVNLHFYGEFPSGVVVGVGSIAVKRCVLKKGLIELGDNRLPTLTNAGKAKIKPFKPSLLDKNTVLMVIFDIPEDQRPKRDRLRAILKMLDFKLIQKSTWVAKTDCREYLAMEVRHNQLEDYVQIYEAKKLKI